MNIFWLYKTFIPSSIAEKLQKVTLRRKKTLTLASPTTTKYPWWHHGRKVKAPPATSEERSCFLNTSLVSKAQRDHNIKSSIFMASSQPAADLFSVVTKMLAWLWLRLPYYTTTWAKLNATFLCVTLNGTEMTSYPSCLRPSSQLFAS